MDLTDILRRRTESDLAVATARSLALSLEIEKLATELKSLREKASRAKLAAEPAVEASDLRPVTEAPSVESRSRSKPTSSLHRKIIRKLSGKGSGQPKFNWHFDEIAGVFPVRDKNGIAAAVSATGVPSVTMSGWVVPIDSGSAFSEVMISLHGNNGTIVRKTHTYQRPDVAAHFGNAALSSCGFRVEVPMFELSVGGYEVTITSSTSDGQSASLSAGSIVIS